VYSEAESHFEKSLQIIPDSLQSYTNLAKTYRINHKRDEALQLAEQGVQRFPTDPYLLRQKAELLKQKGAYSEAVDTYENLLRVDDSSKIHLATGELLEQLGYHTRALGHYRAAAASVRQNATAFFRAARILYKIGNLDESLQWSRKGLNIALQVMDHEQQSLKTLIKEESGWLHGENGKKIAQTIKIQQDLIDEHFHFINQNFDHKDSEPIVKDLLNRHKKSAHLSMLAGRYYMDAGKMHEGHKLFKRSLLLNPKLAESHRALGAYYMERNAYRKAIRSYEKSLTLEPLHSETYASLINLYRKIGQLDRLCDRWLALYKSQSDNKTLRKHLIEALHKSDRLKEVKQVISMQ
ncbi:MAG: tetratricopeptide repeat protein, partial [Balneolaceae bacterium]|nr:tetratricopeptide repeat protein [Balneolaceae bacterium]